jgi:anhydro-N-acetylmuramic acid kinase
MEYYIGLMSGTSMDAVDGALVGFSAPDAPFRFEVLQTHSLPLPLDFKQKALSLHPPTASGDPIYELLELDALLAEPYAQVVRALLGKSGKPLSDIGAVGCHGQTIRHQPEALVPFTLQIGDPHRLAVLTGLPVISDFRRKDVALGGQGAPLACGFHAAAFADQSINRCIVNLGGMANITLLRPNCDVLGFDTGPANVLMDLWALRHTGQAFDQGGRWALSGTINADLLASFQAHEFIRRAPPKSTGREDFNAAWLDRILLSFAEIVPQDVQATLLAFTVSSISDSIVSLIESGQVYLCGGGAYNQALRQALQKNLGPSFEVFLTDALGLDVSWVEAVAFAWLARQHMHHLPGNIPSVTGARQLGVLGSKVLP